MGIIETREASDNRENSEQSQWDTFANGYFGL